MKHVSASVFNFRTCVTEFMCLLLSVYIQNADQQDIIFKNLLYKDCTLFTDVSTVEGSVDTLTVHIFLIGTVLTTGKCDAQ